MKKTTLTLLVGSLALATAYGADDFAHLTPVSRGVAQKRAESKAFRDQLFAGAEGKIEKFRSLHEQQVEEEKIKLQKAQQENQLKLQALVESVKSVSAEKNRLEEENRVLEEKRQELQIEKTKIEESRERNVGILQEELDSLDKELEKLMGKKLESDRKVSKLSNSETLLKMQLEALRREQQYLFANLGGQAQPILAPDFGADDDDDLLRGSDSDGE